MLRQRKRKSTTPTTTGRPRPPVRYLPVFSFRQKTTIRKDVIRNQKEASDKKLKKAEEDLNRINRQLGINPLRGKKAKPKEEPTGPENLSGTSYE